MVVGRGELDFIDFILTSNVLRIDSSGVIFLYEKTSKQCY